MYVLILEAKLEYGAPNGSEIWDPKTGSKTGLPLSVTDLTAIRATIIRATTVRATTIRATKIRATTIRATTFRAPILWRPCLLLTWLSLPAALPFVPPAASMAPTKAWGP